MNIHQMVLVAQSMVEGREIDATNELGYGKGVTGKNKLWEYNKRISSLTPDQLQVLAYGNINSQRQMAFLSICKTYGFIRDFVIEVLREKLLVFDYQIQESDYLSFFRKKAELHPKMESFTENSQKKIRQITFKILQQAEIIDSTRNKKILMQFIDTNIKKVIQDDNPVWMKVFLI